MYVIRCKMVDLVVMNCQAFFLHISIRLFVNLPWIVQANLDFDFTNEENINQPIINQFFEIAQRCISWTLIWKAYRQRTTQELQILTMDEHPGNDQDQQPRGRRGVRMHDGRVHNRGRGRRGQEQRRISDEIRATIVDHYNGWSVQLNIGRSTISSIIQTFWNSLFQSISHIQ